MAVSMQARVFVERLAFDNLSISCKAGQIEIKIIAVFAGNIEAVKCDQWILTTLIDGSTSKRETLCTACTADNSHSLSGHSHLFTNRLMCSTITDITAKALNRVIVNVGPDDDCPIGGKFITATLEFPCFDNQGVSNLRELAPIQPPDAHWKQAPDFWSEMFWGCYQRIAMSAMRLNTPAQPAFPAAAMAGTRPLLMLPVFVMTLPHRKDRRTHMEALLPALGLRSPAFPAAAAAADTDVAALIREGRVDPTAPHAIAVKQGLGAAAVPAYVAHALAVLDVLQRAVDAGLEWFLVAEDDLMPAGTIEEVIPPAARRILFPRHPAVCPYALVEIFGRWVASLKRSKHLIGSSRSTAIVFLILDVALRCRCDEPDESELSG